jgi:hypothetical protein
MRSASAILLVLIVSCTGAGPSGSAGGTGGDEPEGGTGGSATGTGGAPSRPSPDAAADTGGVGAGGEGGSPEADAGPAADVEAAADTGAAETPPPPPPASGQGPVAMGTIVFSQDFEKDMVGINRGMANLPPDRVQVVDDPLGQRGKVLRVVFQKGDNFRTSAGTNPRSWVSNRPNGYEFAPGKKVSHAFGIMTQDTVMNYCFAQIISTGGPVWMLIGGGNNELSILFNGSSSMTMAVSIEPNKWHDFRVDTDFRAGGSVKMYHDGQLFRTGTISNTRGDLAHWDGGIYNRAAGVNGPTRTVYISNLSVGEW